jgi:minor histocompatibility antigen H13
MAGTRAAAAKAAEEEERIEDALHVAAPLAHAALVALAVAPMFMGVEANFNILATATLAVYAGAHRAVRPVAAGNTEAMTKQDAMRFPLIGSCVLFSFFLLFKFLPKDLVNKILTGYFVLLGIFALTATFAPVLGLCMPRSVAGKSFYFGTLPTIPFVTDAPQRIELSIPEMFSSAAAVGFCAWYIMHKHWLANNALGLAFALQGIEFLTLDSIQVGAILLTGLFFYDIFWVFFTPVMVTVAKSFDAPIKLLFPRALDAAAVAAGTASPFSMLGLGDIVIPGCYVALTLRMDQVRADTAAAAGLKPPAKYFPTVVGGYFAGLATTIVVMNVFQAAQPALLYIVPGILGATFLRALLAGEVVDVWKFAEGGGPEEEEGEEEEEPKKKK